MSKKRFSLLMVISIVLVLSSTLMASAYSEAPALKERVGAGELEPVDERLPENPLVMKPLRSIGKYGGTWHRFSTAEEWNFFRMNLYGHSFLRYTEDGTKIEANLFESVEGNEDRTVYTLKLRKGVRWSDGDLVTVDDVIFWWEDMAKDQSCSRAIPVWSTIGGVPMKVTKIDDYTMTWEFAKPNPLLPDQLAMWPDAGLAEIRIVPSHYLKQFHPKYNDQYETYEIFEEKMMWWLSPGTPVLTAWVPVEHQPGQRIIFKRNPYYYAVDTAGNQLPYIDRVELEYLSDNEVFKLKVTQGESDMQIRPGVLTLRDISMLKQNESSGDYRVILWGSGSGTGSVFFPNQTHRDLEKRELYQNDRFLKAISYAINRKKIQKMIYFNQGFTTTGTMSPKAAEYHTEKGKKLFGQWRDLAKAYEPEKAEKMLDDIGVVDQDGDGWRDLPSGKKLELRIDQDVNAADEHIDAAQLVAQDWKAIGLNAFVNPVDGSQLADMDRNSSWDIKDSWEVGDGPNHLVYPQWMVPLTADRWAPWYGVSNSLIGTSQENEDLDLVPAKRTPPREKPEDGSPYVKLYDLYEKAITLPTVEERNELVYEMIKIHIEEGPFFIGVVADYPRVGIVKNNFKNVPNREDLPLGGFVNPWIVVYPAIVNPPTFWIAQ